MASQSITNKLVANIKQANDVSTNFFTGTNVVCIDTSNRRIGIDTKTPTWSIDISGVESYNGVKCHNLDISGTADISYANIGFLRTPSLFIDVIDISNGYFKKIDASLIDVNDVNFNSISGDFIYSNNTISGNFLQCFSGEILNNLDICGRLTAKDFTFGEDVVLKKVNVDLSFTTQSTSNSLFQGNVDFSNSNPVTYITISGNHINTFSISCNNLQLKQQADFSSINVSAEASFNTINVSGDAVFSTISTSNILIQGLSIEQFVTNNSTSQLSKHITDISINALYGKQLFIKNNMNENFVPPPDNFNSIDNLIINNSLDLSYNINGGTSLILPYKELTNQSERRIGNIFYSKDSTGVINGLQIIKSTPQYAINDTPNGDTITLKQVLTKFYMLEASGTIFHDCGNEKYKCVGMNIHSNQVTGDTIIDVIDPFYVNITNNITTTNIEINANITVSLNNDNNGNDVDALNYEFFIFGLTSIGEIANDIKNTKLVSNKNTILVFDNSYNYNSTSLHYIGSKNDINIIIFGVSYENVPLKNLSLNLVNFSASIKGIN